MRSNEPPHAFISYTRLDGEEFATRLRERLVREHPEITLWQDRTDMEGGKGWWNQITEALDQVRVLVLVMTPHAVASEVCRKEWQYARQYGVCVRPVKGLPDAEFDYGSLPNWMQKAHFIDLEKEWEKFIKDLKNPPVQMRVPFMAPDLPQGFVKRPVVQQSLRGRILAVHRNGIDPQKVHCEKKRVSTIAVVGASGFGKTSLVVDVCHDDEVINVFDDGILWATLGQDPNLLQELAKLYAALTGERPPFVDVEDAAIHLGDKLGEKDCLLVVDDVWDPVHLQPFLRGGKKCLRLVTTRQQFEVAEEAEAIRMEVDVMTESESVQVLTKRLEQEPSDLEPFRKLAKRLGEWPLLLKLTGSALKRRIDLGDSVPGALTYINAALNKRGVVAFSHTSSTNRNSAIETSVGLSLGLLNENERVRCAELAIFHELVTVPIAVISALWGLEEFETADLVQRLHDASLIQYDLKTGSIRMHEALRNYLASSLKHPANLHGKLVDAWKDVHALPDSYAWRWLAWHLRQAGQSARVKELLLDFDWLQAKLEATDIDALLQDFTQVEQDESLKVLQRALRLSAYILSRHKAEAASQLLGRLRGSNLDYIKQLLVKATNWKGGFWLNPLHPTLTPPGPLWRRLPGHEAGVRAIAITPDGKIAISGSRDNTVKVWDLELGQTLRTLNGHRDVVNGVAITLDGGRILSASGDGTLRLWDLHSGQLLRCFEGHTGGVRAIAVVPDGRRAVSGGDDQTLRMWDLETGVELSRFEGHTGGILTVAVTTDSAKAVSGSGDHTLKVWDLATKKELGCLLGHTAGVNAVALTQDGKHAVSGSSDRTLRLWGLLRCEPLCTLEGHANEVKAVALTANGTRAVSGSSDKSIRVWDLKNGQPLLTLQGHADWVWGVSVTPDGNWAVSVSDDRKLIQWDLECTLPASFWKGHAGEVMGLMITSDGRWAVSAARDQTLRLWDLQSGQEARSIKVGPSAIVAVAITPDGRRALLASEDKKLRLWSLENGEELRSFEGHTDRIASVTITPDGKRAVSASRDETLKVWDLDSGQCVARFSGDAPLSFVTIAPDGQTIGVGESEGRIHFLRIVETRSL